MASVVDKLQAAIEEGIVRYPVNPAAPSRVSDPRFQGLAAEKGYNQDYSRIQKVTYSHEAMIDLIIANPGVSQNHLAEVFGYSVPWISRVIGSDAFQAALAKRREELVDPFITASIEERFKGVINQSIDILANKLDATKSADMALKALDIGVKALGMGARDRGGSTVQNNFVVALPGKAETSQSWAEKHGGQVVEATTSLSSTVSRNPLIQPEVTRVLESEK